MRQARVVLCAIAVIAVIGPAATAVSATASPAASHKAAAKPRLVHGDLDGDGTPDLVVGTVSGNRVLVRYSKAKVHGSHSQWLTSPQPQTYDFGAAVAVGDFNGDGIEDLAVGAPQFRDINGDQQGAVYLYYGSKKGLHYSHVVLYGPDDVGVYYQFGTSLSAGTVDGSRYAELAIGDPTAPGTTDSEGSVTLVDGTKKGWSTSKRRTFVSSDPVEQGMFGTTVSLADVNGDGRTDLIVGEPGGGPVLPGTTTAAGDIQELLATKTGFAAAKTFLGSTLGAAGGLGSSLATGRINKDKYADVVAGAPMATVSGLGVAGEAAVIFGSKHGLTAAGAKVLSKASAHVAGDAASTDRFGYSVAVGDLTADRLADVIVGVPGGTSSGKAAAGQVYVFRGTRAGVTTVRSQLVTQATKGLGGSIVAGSELGYSVSTLGLASAAHRVLIVGMPFMHQGGRVFELLGGTKGVTGAHSALVKDPTESDGFGGALAQ